MIEDNKNSLEKTNKSFASGLNCYKIFWIFFIGCILGVVIETIWCIITRFRIESRSGLIYGPFNLVYGFGAVIITLSLYWLYNKRDLWVFVGGMLVGGVYEYLCSWVQEKIFGTVSWEYSQMNFNLNGRISLLYCFFWGILALIWVKQIYPVLSNLIEKIPNRIGASLTWALFIFMIFNTGISGLVVERQTERREGIQAVSSLDKYLDKHYSDEVLKKIYPNMIYVIEK
ncbi:putative ABC transporter permease [Clostridium intestinale]|jgi:uncharacterized membrane protein|uniref:ABC transporter permease n=1 Tax=Clostridium intestinale URNW TaxID=1294142 RepID=U2N746_9CLOT|nr:putative ABC transporter permease [Clostridium intestinale]ERK31342.1 hypothetical protein CINTURNW_2419 [Clostridium intestinale URNW]